MFAQGIISLAIIGVLCYTGYIYVLKPRFRLKQKEKILFDELEKIAKELEE